MSATANAVPERASRGPGVRPRAAVALLAAGAALWTAAYAVVYILVAQHQDDADVAWWYVAVLAVCALAAVVAPFIPARLALLIAVGAVLTGCVLLGLLSVGLLLIPAVGLVALAAALPNSSPATAR